MLWKELLQLRILALANEKMKTIEERVSPAASKVKQSFSWANSNFSSFFFFSVILHIFGSGACFRLMWSNRPNWWNSKSLTFKKNISSLSAKFVLKCLTVCRLQSNVDFFSALKCWFSSRRLAFWLWSAYSVDGFENHRPLIHLGPIQSIKTNQRC